MRWGLSVNAASCSGSNNSELKVEEPLREVSIRVYLTWFGISQVGGGRVTVTVFRAGMRDAEGLEAQEPW